MIDNLRIGKQDASCPKCQYNAGTFIQDTKLDCKLQCGNCNHIDLVKNFVSPEKWQDLVNHQICPNCKKEINGKVYCSSKCKEQLKHKKFLDRNDKIIHLYQHSTLTTTEIAKQFNISSARLSQITKSIERRPRVEKVTTRQKRKQLIDLAKIMTIDEISEKLNIKKHIIKKFIKGHPFTSKPTKASLVREMIKNNPTLKSSSILEKLVNQFPDRNFCIQNVSNYKYEDNNDRK